MEKIILVKPNLSYANEIQRYKKEFLEDEPIINVSAGLDSFKKEEQQRYSSRRTCPFVYLFRDKKKR